jgi:hypothetical protein
MKNYFLILSVTLLFSACNQTGNKTISTAPSVPSLNKEVIDFASDYAMGKFKNPVKSVSADGVVTVAENNYSYVISPLKIYTGLIDYDNLEDAIVSIDYYHDQYVVLTEHLILIKSEDKLTLNRSIESDMRIIGIKDREITAEVYTRSRNGPLANCNVCKEVVKYHFIKGELVRAE